MPIGLLFFFVWRLAPLLFAFAYAWALWAADHVWDLIVIYQPGWSMPSELGWATAHMALAALVSCGLWVLAIIEPDERRWYEQLPFWLAMIPAAFITFFAAILAFPFILAAANQPAVYIPIFGVLVACPLCWAALLGAAS